MGEELDVDSHGAYLGERVYRQRAGVGEVEVQPPLPGKVEDRLAMCLVREPQQAWLLLQVGAEQRSQHPTRGHPAPSGWFAHNASPTFSLPLVKQMLETGSNRIEVCSPDVHGARVEPRRRVERVDVMLRVHVCASRTPPPSRGR